MSYSHFFCSYGGGSVSVIIGDFGGGPEWELLNRDSTNYTEVRHIVLKGTNEQIGKALGGIAQEDYNAKPGRFVDPVYARARLIYMQNNYPAFYERMKGVAERVSGKYITIANLT